MLEPRGAVDGEVGVCGSLLSTEESPRTKTQTN